MIDLAAFSEFIQIVRLRRVRFHLRHDATFFRLFEASVHTERTGAATFSRLKLGWWRAQVRRKEKYVNETFVRRKDAEERARHHR